MFAMEESTSKACARESMRGSRSRAMRLMPCALSASTLSWLFVGLTREMTVAPFRRPVSGTVLKLIA